MTTTKAGGPSRHRSGFNVRCLHVFICTSTFLSKGQAFVQKQKITTARPSVRNVPTGLHPRLSLKNDRHLHLFYKRNISQRIPKVIRPSNWKPLYASPEESLYSRSSGTRSSSVGLFPMLLRLGVVLAFYMLHLLVLSQRQIVFPVQLLPNEKGHFTGLGYDSLAGMAFLLIYGVRQSRLQNNLRRSLSSTTSLPWILPRNSLRFRIMTTLTFVLLVQAYFLTGRWSIFWEDILYELSARDVAITVPVFRAMTVLLGHLTWVAIGSALLKWLPRPPPFFQYRRYGTATQAKELKRSPDVDDSADDEKRLRSSNVDPPPTETKIVKKLFRTDISTLYSKDGLPPKKPTEIPFRNKDTRQTRGVSPITAKTDDAGSHTSQESNPLSYYWFSARSSGWMWWTIGGYVSAMETCWFPHIPLSERNGSLTHFIALLQFVSSWLFNVADFANQYLLSTKILQDAQESVVSQLVNPEHNDVVASVIGYIAPCISAPWWEEVLYRGFCLPAMTQLVGLKLAVFFQGIVFSAHHMSLTGALPLAVLGWTWATIYVKSRNLTSVIIIHMLWNSRVFLGSWLGL